ncbi:MAG: tetratricopeptide repeat protein [Bryobacteraceae bacterium]
MIHPARTFLIAVLVAAGLYGQTPAPKPPANAGPGTAEKSGAYYNFAMGHLYAELAAAYGNRGEHFGRAIDHYKEALRLDPSASFLIEELTDLYIQSGRLKDAVTETEAALKQNPDNLNARRTLGRIYMRMIGDPQQNRINEKMLAQSIEQFQKVVEKDSKDVESLLILGRLQRVARDSVEAEKAYKKVLEIDENHEEALTGLAMVYSDVGNTAGAIEMLRRVTDRNPNSRTLMALASAYEQMQDHASAAEVLRRALQLAPDNGQIKRELAQSLAMSNRVDEAVSLFEDLAASEPKDAQNHLRLAELYRTKQNFPKAWAALNKAKELDKNSLETRFAEAGLLETEGKTPEAIAVMEAMLEETAKTSYSRAEKSTRVLLLERLGQLRRQAGRYQPAVEAFRQIGELDAELAPRVVVQIIDTLRMAKDYTAALTESEAARAKYPDNRVVSLVHASLLADMGKSSEAIALMRTLFDGKRDRETWLAIAQVHEKTKNFSEMEKALESAEKLSSTAEDKEGVHFMRGAMYEKSKNYDASEAEFRKVLEINPDNAGALNYLGYMLADRNVRLEEARKLIVRALELDPQNGAYLDSLGWVQFRLNEFDEAENNLKKAIDRVGNDPTVHDHLGDVYWKQGKIRDAIAQWQAAVREWESSSEAEVDRGQIAKIKKKLEDARIRLAQETTPGAQR